MDPRHRRQLPGRVDLPALLPARGLRAERIAFNSDDYFAIQGFVAAGMGASLIPDLALISVRDDIVIRSLGKRPPVRGSSGPRR